MSRVTDHNLKLISWNITKKCNLRCAHCYLPADFRSDDIAEGDPSCELTTRESLSLIDQIARVNTEVMLILSGGEPLLRGDIFRLAHYASGKGMMIVVGTNGLLIDSGISVKLKQNGVSGVSVSLDSAKPESHDRARSHEGAWEKAVNAIHACRDAGLSVQINTVVTMNNYAEVPEIIQFARTLGARVFSPFFLVCTGRGEKLTDITPLQ